MSEWQPISSAPRDGTCVLLGRFTNGKAQIDHNGKMAVDYWHSRDVHDFEGWGKFNSRYWPATHWMPLPARPDVEAR